MKHSPVTILGAAGARRGRAGNAWIIGLVLFFLIVIIALHLLAKQESANRQTMLNRSQLDPKDMATRYFLEATKDLPFDGGGWKELIQFMSDEDMAWLERNKSILASLAAQKPAAGDEEAERYAALQALLRFAKSFDRPVVTRWSPRATRGDLRARQGNANSMRACSSSTKAGVKFRRFLGRRDDYDIMKPLLQAHERPKAA